MTKKRNVYDDQFKAKVALAAIKDVETIAELSSRYNVHITQIRKWKAPVFRKSSHCI